MKNLFRKKSKKEEINHLLKFEGKPIVLPKGYEWCVHKQLTTGGLVKMKHMKFKDFDQAIHKWQDGNFHLFELRTNGVRLMAYCVINKCS